MLAKICIFEFKQKLLNIEKRGVILGQFWQFWPFSYSLTSHGYKMANLILLLSSF